MSSKQGINPYDSYTHTHSLDCSLTITGEIYFYILENGMLYSLLSRIRNKIFLKQNLVHNSAITVSSIQFPNTHTHTCTHTLI